MKCKRMFRSWRKTSIESQESMEQSNKRQKVSAEKEECELTGVPIHKHTSIKIGETKVWAPGLLLFNKYFKHLSAAQPLTPAIVQQAKEKCGLQKDSPEFHAFVQAEIEDSSQDETSEEGMQDLNIQKFWLFYLSVLEKRLLSHLKLDHPATLSGQILKLYYHIILMLHCNIPDEAVACVNSLCKTLDTTIMGADFWEYNPILLTKTHYWAHQFVDDLLQDHSKRIRTTSYIPFSFYLSSMHHPFPPLPEVSESQVCDQQLAVRLARGELPEYDLNEWNSSGNWLMLSGGGVTNFNTTLGNYSINAISY